MQSSLLVVVVACHHGISQGGRFFQFPKRSLDVDSIKSQCSRNVMTQCPLAILFGSTLVALSNIEQTLPHRHAWCLEFLFMQQQKNPLKLDPCTPHHAFMGGHPKTLSLQLYMAPPCHKNYFITLSAILDEASQIQKSTRGRGSQ